jgi:hypothetical protein
MEDEKRVSEPTATYAATTYYEVLNRARRLTPADQLRLLEELASLARQMVTAPARRSILEIQGLGKEIWQGVDAQEYIDQERASWNG